MPHQPTRREALVQLTAGAGASTALASWPPAALAQTTYEPKTLTGEQFKILTVLVEMIIPATDTPGAAAVGVDRMIDKSLAEQDGTLVRFLGGLSQLEQSGFADLEEADRVRLLEKYSGASDARGDFFRLLKGLTVDYYYSSEVGLVDELGYEGNTALGEFPGCTHDEHR
jgi:hypothetical protein